MKKDLKVIDGSKDKFAPPPHHGLIRAIYDTVDACGGANLAQIKKYLPAAIDNISQVLRKKRLQRALYSCVYRGYLIHDDTRKPEYWQIAPLEYYDKRQAYCKDMEARVKTGTGTKRGEYLKVEAQSMYFTIKLNKVVLYRIATGLAVIAVFVLGAVLGRVL